MVYLTGQPVLLEWSRVGAFFGFLPLYGLFFMGRCAVSDDLQCNGCDVCRLRCKLFYCLLVTASFVTSGYPA